MDNSQSDVNDTICQIDEISNIEKDDLPSSASQSTENIPGDHQLDSTNGAVLSATINSKDEESQSISTDAEFWKSIGNYLSLGFLIVTIAVEAIGVIYYIHIKNRNRFDYVNSYFDGVEIISIVEVGFLALFLIFLILSASVCQCSNKTDKKDVSNWTFSASLLISFPLLLLLLVVGLGIGDEGANYLFWNKQHHPIINDLNETSSIFSYTVNRSVSYKSLKYALPPSEFYDIVARMIADQMNLTETRKFLEKYNCNDRLSFPISFDPLLTPIGRLLGTSNSICVQ